MMIQLNRHDGVRALLLVALACGGCGNSLPTASLGIPAVSALPSLPKLPKLPEAHGQSSLPPIEAYALVARGATNCWFGAGGALKKSYVFYADADPPSNGGKAEISLLDRVEGGETPRGARAYRIAFIGSAGGTSIEQSNVKLSEELAAAVEADVARFGRGTLSCAESGPTAPRADAPAPVVSTKPKAKVKTKVSASGKL